MSADAQPLSETTPPRVLSFESRRQSEMHSLIARQGGVPTVVASMRELPLDDHVAAFNFADEVLAGRLDDVIFMTGVGAEALLNAVVTRHDREEFLTALSKCRIIVRGPKPFAVLRQWPLRVDHRVPEPNTWRELLTMLDELGELHNRNVAVQEYGIANRELYAELTVRGANVQPVAIYRWGLPTDVTPLQQAIRDTIAGQFDVLLFTSAQQIVNVLSVAEDLQLADEWLQAAQHLRVGSIGPTASEQLRELGLPVTFEASPPKMGPLARLACAPRQE